MVSIQQRSEITMNKFRVKINLILYFVVNFMIIMVILVFFMVISVNRRLFRNFGSYSGISVIYISNFYHSMCLYFQFDPICLFSKFV